MINLDQGQLGRTGVNLKPLALGTSPASGFSMVRCQNAEEAAALYDLLSKPLIEALCETVTQIGAHMISHIAGRASRQGLEHAWDSCIQGDADVSVKVRSIEAPHTRVYSHYHLAQAARLIECASTLHRKWMASPSSITVGAILQPLRAGWRHLQNICAGGTQLVDLRPCCGGAYVRGSRI
jgi:hypothetical protein